MPQVTQAQRVQLTGIGIERITYLNRDDPIDVLWRPAFLLKFFGNFFVIRFNSGDATALPTILGTGFVS